MRRVFFAIAAIATAAVLAGCSTTRTVDSDVQAFSTIAAIPAGATYRFERLPSQQARFAQQDPLEQLAQQALERVGLKRDDTAAKYSVQVGLNAQRQVRYDPWNSGWGPGWGYGGLRGYGGRRGYYGGYGFYSGWGGPGAFPDRILYQQQVDLVVRDLGTGQVVYETHAAHDSLQPADATVLTVMLDSALYGFPKAPAGIRQVNVEIPR